MNDEVKNKINRLRPPELEETKKFIELLIETKSTRRKTNLEY